MAVFISVTTNAFEEVFADNQSRPTPKNVNIRRPLRGIEVKEDTYSVIKIIDSLGRDLPIISSSATNSEGNIGKDTHYANFIITNVQETRVEKQQIVETFGEDFIFFFGERPRTLTFTGALLNTNDFNWKSEFWTNYEQYLRGTRLVESNARAYIYWDDVVVEGYFLQAQTVLDTNSPYHMAWSFQFFVTNYAFLSNVGNIFIPTREGKTGMGTDQWDTRGELEEITAGNLPADTGASGGSLSAFLTSAQEFQNSASFSIQSTLETIKNTFYGRRLVVPRGIGNQLFHPPIDNQAQLRNTSRGLLGYGVPIHQQRDEFVESESIKPQYDQAELERVRKELRIRSPKELEAEARQQLAALGIDVTRRNTNYLLLGRAAFAGLQTFGSFGMRQADGALNIL